MDYKTGDLIIYRNNAGSLREVRVTERSENVTDTGKPGFYGTVTRPEEWEGISIWGHDSQIIPPEEIDPLELAGGDRRGDR